MIVEAQVTIAEARSEVWAVMTDIERAADKWITEAVDQASYSTRAESDGFVFTSTTGMTGPDGSITLTTTHVSEPQTLVARVQSTVMGLLFKGVARNRSRPG